MSVQRRITYLLLVTVSSFVMGGCLWPTTFNYQGRTSRPVVVTVVDVGTGKPVSSAVVKLAPDEDMQHFLDKTTSDKKKYEDITGSNGKVELLIWFPCGGKKTQWLVFPSDKGKFSLEGAGTLHVGAGGYEHFERKLSVLTSKPRRSVNDKSAVKVSVKLKPNPSDN